MAAYIPVIGWAIMLIVCVVVALFSAMLGLMANMDRGGIHPVLAGVSATFVAIVIFLLFHAPFSIG